MSSPPISSIGSPDLKMPISMSLSYSALVHRRLRAPEVAITAEGRRRHAGGSMSRRRYAAAPSTAPHGPWSALTTRDDGLDLERLIALAS
jgi:hypothetical protein